MIFEELADVPSAKWERCTTFYAVFCSDAESREDHRRHSSVGVAVVSHTMKGTRVLAGFQLFCGEPDNHWLDRALTTGRTPQLFGAE